MADEINKTPEAKPHEVSGFWWWMSNNWKKTLITYIIPIFVFLGGVTHFEEIRDSAKDVWNMPANGKLAIAKSDSIDIIILRRVEALEESNKTLISQNNILKKVVHHTTLGLSQETDPMQYKGIRFNATNPHYSTGLSTYWLFIEDKECDLLIPYELKYNVQIDGYEYYDYVHNKKEILAPSNEH